MEIAKSGVAGITEKYRKAFELFLKALVSENVESEVDFLKLSKRFNETAKHIGVSFDDMMKESALWMKQCVPGGNKKWSLDMSSFSKPGFDKFFKYAPEEIKSILKSGGQPLLNIFSEKLVRDAHASLKTINLEEYEKLVKKVDPSVIMQVYNDCGYTKMTGEDQDSYIGRAISLDYRDAHDDASLMFDVDALVGSESFASFDRGFELFVYYNGEDMGSLEAQESALNEESVKKMIEAILLEKGVVSKVEFIATQEKIDEKTIDLQFELLSPPTDGDKEGLASIVLTKPELYKEIVVKKEVVQASKRTYHDDVYDMLENWDEDKATAIKNKILIPNQGQKHYSKLEKNVYNYVNGMGDLSNSMDYCRELISEDSYPAADVLQEKNDKKLAKLEEDYKTKIEPFVVKYTHANVSSLKQKIDTMFAQTFPRAVVHTKSKSDNVEIEIEIDDTKCEFRAYEDGELVSEGCDTNFDPILKKGIVLHLKSVLGEHETTAAISDISKEELKEFVELASQLSAENLYGDGEYSKKEIDAKYKEIDIKWRALEKKCGHRFTVDEINDYEWEKIKQSRGAVDPTEREYHDMLNKFRDTFNRLSMSGCKDGETDDVNFKHRSFKAMNKNGKVLIEFKGLLQYFPNWRSFEEHFKENFDWYAFKGPYNQPPKPIKKTESAKDIQYFEPNEAKKEASNILAYMSALSKNLVDIWKDHEVSSSSSPAGPDTSKFIATHSGMIEYMHGEVVYGGHYGSNKYVSAGIKIGGNVDSKVTEEIKEKFIEEFSDFQSKFGGDSKHHIRIRFGNEEYGPHYSITLVDKSGSNWGCIGIEVQKRDGNGDNNTKVSYLDKP